MINVGFILGAPDGPRQKGMTCGIRAKHAPLHRGGIPTTRSTSNGLPCGSRECTFTRLKPAPACRRDGTQPRFS
jgi:hypothetical protein